MLIIRTHRSSAWAKHFWETAASRALYLYMIKILNKPQLRIRYLFLLWFDYKYLYYSIYRYTCKILIEKLFFDKLSVTKYKKKVLWLFTGRSSKLIQHEIAPNLQIASTLTCKDVELIQDCIFLANEYAVSLNSLNHF